ncbi:unnamed protein product [Meloidogyne enterolobii]|uniref:Uncharacterized protein n=1 Tax=Meloidogyne enterolobii TaxID=390850 RepID=A0ACB0ZSA7_MELEN
MSNVCDGFIQIFDIGDSSFIAFEDSEQILQKYRLICSSFYHSKCAEDSNVLPFLPVILFSEQVQVLVENGMKGVLNRINFLKFEGFAQICRVNNSIEGIESFSEINGKLDKSEPKRKRALFGADAPSNLLKIRKIDHLNENNNNEKATSNEIESCENEELQLIINELRLRNVEKEMNSKRNLNSYAYEKPPGEQHSLFMVICSDVNKSLNSYNLIATSRVSTQVKKKILLAVVSPGTLLPYYLEMNWWKGDGNR